MNKFFFCFLFLTCELLAQVTFNPAEKDTFVFAGDSITHQCLYTQYAEKFLYTRYHDLNLHCFSAGIGGDKASDLLNRFEEDVSFQKPAWVTVLLGMNDGGYKNYSDENFALYKKNMSTIIQKIKELAAEAVLISPSMFDHQQYRLRHEAGNFRFSRLNAHENYNAKLAFYGGWIRATANDQKLNFVDFWGPLNDLSSMMRQKQPKFTFMPDAIHPDPNGMAIMAAQLANFFKGNRGHIPPVVISINSQHSDNLNQLTATSENVKCRVTPKYLPWVLTGTKETGPAPHHYLDDPSLGFKKIIEKYQYNREIIQVTGLTNGTYQILMNGTALKEQFSHLQLAKGIDISQNEESATYKQSLALAKLNAQRNNEGLRAYRNLQAKMKGQRRKLAKTPEKLAAFRQSIQPQLDASLKVADDYEKQIHKLAVPKTYTLEINRINN